MVLCEKHQFCNLQHLLTVLLRLKPEIGGLSQDWRVIPSTQFNSFGWLWYDALQGKQRQLNGTLWFIVTFFCSLFAHTLLHQYISGRFFHTLTSKRANGQEAITKPWSLCIRRRSPLLPWPKFDPLISGCQCLPFRGKTAVGGRYYSLIQPATTLSSL